jgi:hypothetical protein
MALGYVLDDLGFESRQGLRILLFTTVSILALGPKQPPIEWVTGTGALTLGVKRPRREADHSPSGAEVKNEWSYTSTPPIRLHGVVLKAQGRLYVYVLHIYNAHLWAMELCSSEFGEYAGTVPRLTEVLPLKNLGCEVVLLVTEL